MSGTLRVFTAVSVTVNGQTRTGGRLDIPHGETSCEGAPLDMDHDYTVDAATDADDRTTWGRQVLFDHSYDGYEWELLDFSVVGEGTVELWWLTDVPTSTTDLSPQNVTNTIRWFNTTLSNKRPFGFDSPLCASNVTAATMVGGTGGYPTGATSASTTAARIYKVVAYNASIDADVTIRRRLVF